MSTKEWQLYSPAGNEYRGVAPAEYIRLKAQGYTDEPPKKDKPTGRTAQADKSA